MRVYDADHCGPMSRVLVDSVGEVAHAVDLNKCINVDLKFVNIKLDQLLDSVFPQIVHQVYNERDTRKNYNNMAVNSNEFHQNGIKSNPEVEVYQTARKNAHNLVVEGDLLVVLETQHQTSHKIDRDQDPAASL